MSEKPEVSHDEDLIVWGLALRAAESRNPILRLWRVPGRLWRWARGAWYRLCFRMGWIRRPSKDELYTILIDPASEVEKP